MGQLWALRVLTVTMYGSLSEFLLSSTSECMLILDAHAYTKLDRVDFRQNYGVKSLPLTTLFSSVITLSCVG